MHIQMKYQYREDFTMFGMIRRYLKGRAKIIAKRQLVQGAKKVAQSVKDRKSLKTKAKSQILAFIVSISLIIPPYTFATNIVHDPQSFAQSYAQFVESIEKYNNMIKTAQDTLDTMNRINDVMNTANNTLNNLQTGLADPRQLYDRFQSNLESIKENAERIGKSLENRNWSESIFKKEFATCKKKWQNLMKEVREYEEQKAKNEYDSAVKQGDGSEESEQEISKTKQKYEDLQETKEIQADLKMLEDRYNGALSKGTKEINDFFNQMQYHVDITNIETKAREHKNPYQKQINVCNKVEEKEIEFNIRKAKEGYFTAVAEGRHADARKFFVDWKKYEKEKVQERQRETEQVLKNSSFFEPNDKETILDINQDTGELNDEEAWKQAMGKEVTKYDVAKKELIPQTDSNGNTKTIEKWLAKPETIKKLFEKRQINEALNLQNQRNMVLALQGDTQAIQKAQAETIMMLSMQINNLNNTVAAIGNIAAHFLKMKTDIQKDYVGDPNKEKEEESEEETENKVRNTFKQNIQSTLGNYEDLFEDDAQTGRAVFKYNNKDTSGILGN